MANEKNLALMADIMGTIVHADEWQDIQLTEPFPKKRTEKTEKK